jgi:hypothetical protein
MTNLHEEGDIRVRSQLDIVLMASLEYSLASSHKGILKPSNLSLFLTGSPLVFIEKPLYTHPDAPENTDDALVVDLSTPYFLTAGVRYRFATWFKLEAGYWLGPDITIGNRTADPPADPYTFELSRFYVSASLVFPGYQEMSKL